MSFLGILIIGLFVQQPQLASVEGIVLRAGTSQPISKAVVELSGTNNSEPLAMATGADGRFQFRNVAPGRYRLAVSRNGYLNSTYGQRGPSGSGTALEIAGGQTLKDVRLVMIASAAVSGRVYDASGEPLANVPVRALKYSYLDGQRTLTPVKTDITDDRGEYRLFWLPPGMYYISAVPDSAGLDEFIVMSGGAMARAMRADARGSILTEGRSTAERLGEANVPVYYPGTTDPQSAMPVEARSGADIGGVDFTLTRMKTRKVRFIVIDGLSGQPVNTSASVMLVPRYPSITGSMGARPSLSGEGFEVQGVLPGSYFLVATYRAPAGKDAVRIMGGRVPVDVGNSDVDRLTMVVSPALDIRGEVTVEGRPAVGADDHHPIVTLKSELAGVPGPANNKYGSFSGNRQFVVNDVIEGDYRVQLEDLPKGAYVKSIRFGATDVLNGNLSIDPRSSERLDIVLSMNAGTLEGVVLNKRREPVPNAPVALVPDAAHRQRADLYRSAYTDESGRFNLQGIAPGNYSVFAWEDIDEGLWRDPEFIRRNEGSGRTVRIVENGRATIELTAIPFEF